MQTLATLIKDAIYGLGKGISNVDGLSAGHLSRIINGKTKPTAKSVAIVAAFLKKHGIDWIVNATKNTVIISGIVYDIEGINAPYSLTDSDVYSPADDRFSIKGRISPPLFVARPAANEKMQLPDAYMEYQVDTDVVARGRFRLIIAGDCMSPRFPDGSEIEFQIFRHNGDDWPIGKSCVFVDVDNMAYFKRLVSVDEDSIVIECLNQDKYPGQRIIPRQTIARAAYAIRMVSVVDIVE